jgi:two-component system LytT family response regulator
MRAIVADDEPLGRQRIRNALRRHPDIELVGVAADGEEAVDVIRAVKPDLVFLDIRMPGCDGFEVLAAVAEDMPPFVIFVTAHDDRTLEAFRVHAADYLVKPFDDARFDEALRHVRKRFTAGGAAPPELRELLATLGAQVTPARYLHRIGVTKDSRTSFVSTAEIRYIEAHGNYVLLHVEGQTHTVRTTLTDLLAQLDPASFVRIHRSTVLNLDYLRDIQPWFTGDYVATLRTGEQLRISRRYRDDLLRAIR